MASNLPPGCNVSDIPGNRPEDEKWENIIDTFWSKDRTPKKNRILRIASTALVELLDEAIEYGIEVGKQEQIESDRENAYYEEMAKDYEKNKELT